MSNTLSGPRDGHWCLIIVRVGPEDVYLGACGSLEAPYGASVMADKVANLCNRDKIIFNFQKSSRVLTNVEDTFPVGT